MQGGIDQNIVRRVRFVRDRINTYRVSIRGRIYHQSGFAMSPAFAIEKAFEEVYGFLGDVEFVWAISTQWQARAKARAKRKGRKVPRNLHAFIVAWEVNGNVGIETVYVQKTESRRTETTPADLLAA